MFHLSMILGLLKTKIPEQRVILPFREKGSKARGCCRTKRFPVVPVKRKMRDEELSGNTVSSDGLTLYARGLVPAQKSRTLPMRVREGPAKNLRLKRRKNAQQDTKTLWSLAGFSISRKRTLLTLAGFLGLLLKIPMK